MKGLWTPTRSAPPDAWATEGMSLCVGHSVAEDRAARARWKVPSWGVLTTVVKPAGAREGVCGLEAVYQPGSGRG